MKRCSPLLSEPSVSPNDPRTLNEERVWQCNEVQYHTEREPNRERTLFLKTTNRVSARESVWWTYVNPHSATWSRIDRCPPTQPVVENITYTSEYVRFDVFDAEHGWSRDIWLPEIMELRAVDLDTEEVTKPPLIDSPKPNHKRWSRKHSLADLPEGSYRLEVFVTDTFSNEIKEIVTESFLAPVYTLEVQ